MKQVNSRSSVEAEQIEQIQDHLNQSVDNQNAQDYTLQFENKYKIYQLNSQVNEANLRLQKMALQYQNSMKEERQYSDNLQAEKNMILQKCEQFQEEYEQINMMLQAEKKYKEEYQQNCRQMQDLMIRIAHILGINEEGTGEMILAEIQNIKDRLNQSNLIIEKLTDAAMGTKEQKNQNGKQEMIEQISMRNVVAKVEDVKYRQLQKSLSEMQQLLSQKQTEIQSMTEKLSNFYKRELQIDQLQKSLECLQWENTTKEEQLRSLRAKQDNWTIARDKSREERIRYDEQLQQLKFQLELSVRKIQIGEGRLREQQLRCKKLEQIIGQYKRKQVQSQQKQMEFHEQYSNLKKKLHISEIYKEKFKQTQSKLKEVEERVHQFSNMTDQYANQIHQLQNQLSAHEVINKELDVCKKQLTFQLQIKEKEIIKGRMTIDHHQEVIKSNQADIERLQKKIEYYEKNGESSFRNSRIEHDDHLRVQTQIVNQDIIKHYQYLLEQEDKNRSQLQKQFQQANTTISQLKNQMNQLQRQYNQVKQEKMLLKQQNIRLTKNNAQIQRLQQKKIDQIRERYRQIKNVNRETNEGPRRRMKIVKCFNLFQQAEATHGGSHIRKVFSQGNSQSEKESNMRRTESSKLLKEENHFKAIDEANSSSETGPISYKPFKLQKISEKLIRPPRLDDEQIKSKENIRSHNRFNNM